MGLIVQTVTCIIYAVEATERMEEVMKIKVATVSENATTAGG